MLGYYMGIHTWETAFKFCYLYSNIKNNNYNPNLLNSLVFSFSHINLVAEVLVTVNGESSQGTSINNYYQGQDQIVQGGS